MRIASASAASAAAAAPVRGVPRIVVMATTVSVVIGTDLS